MVQGTAGTAEEAIRYGWNYARLLAEGPSSAAMVPSPVMTAMRSGAIARIEELTRIPSDVQDGLITILSEKATHFGDGVLRAGDVASGIVDSVVKDPVADSVAWKEYLETVVRGREGWKDFYRACRES